MVSSICWKEKADNLWYPLEIGINTRTFAENLALQEPLSSTLKSLHSEQIKNLKRTRNWLSSYLISLLKKPKMQKMTRKEKPFWWLLLDCKQTFKNSTYSFLGDTKKLKSQISNTCAVCNVTKLFLNTKIWYLHFFINEKHVQK